MCCLSITWTLAPQPGNMKNHMLTNQPAWQRASWKKRIVPETTALEAETSHSDPRLLTSGDDVSSWIHYRPGFIRALFSLTAPGERQHSGPGEVFDQEEKPTTCTQGGLRTRASWAPALLHSPVILGKSITPFEPLSQSANCEYNTSLLGALFMYIKCIEIMPKEVKYVS